MALPKGIELSIALDLAPGCGVDVNRKCGNLAASVLVEHSSILAEAQQANFTVTCSGYDNGCQAQVSGEILGEGEGDAAVLCRLPLAPPVE